MSTESFKAVEAMLMSPPESGYFVAHIGDTSPLGKAGVPRGSIITHVDGTAIEADKQLFQLLQTAQANADKGYSLTALTPEGSKTFNIEQGNPGVDGVFVRANAPAWNHVPDSNDDADFSGLKDGAHSLLRNHLGEARSGYERVRVAHRDNHIVVDQVFWLAGEGEHEWSYRTRVISTHVFDRHLTAKAVHFEQGTAESVTHVGDTTNETEKWRGTMKANGVESPTEFPALSQNPINNYGVKILPLIMPLREGAVLNINPVRDSDGRASFPARIDCVGKQATTVNDRELEAWCFRECRYGKPDPGMDETTLYWVNDDRQMVRIDWGPGYGGCWAEAVSEDEVAEGLPQAVRIETLED